MKNLDPTWEQLLARLRGAGLRVGVDEAIKVHYLFELAANADRAERVRIARAVLVKSEEDGELFERVVRAWEAALAAPANVEQDVIAARPTPGPSGQGGATKPLLPEASGPGLGAPLKAVIGAAAMAMIAVVVVMTWPLDQRDPQQPDAAVQFTEKHADAGTSTSTTDADVQTFRAKIPVITFLGKQRDPRVTGAVAGVVGLLAAVGLYLSIRRRTLLPAVTKVKLRDGPERVALASPSTRNAQLLDRRQQETVVWGIGRFVSDEPTAELDIDKTIDETARADGFPNLYYQFRRHPREVWIWVDESADQATALRLASDIADTLTQAGLPVERASFWGIPEVLLTAEGRDFAPNEVDERRDTALVVIFTDGRILSRQTEAEQRWRRVAVLLRQLSLWPNLVFVDFSRGANNLEHYLAPFGIRVVEPEAMIAFMGGLNEAAAAQQAAPAPTLTGDVRAWAAACALAPAPIDEATAFSMREALGLSASPWGIESVRASAESAGELFAWRGTARAELLRWLRDAAPEVLSQALALWIERYRADDAARTNADAIEPWIDTPAQRFLHMERALLELWSTPESAAAELYALHRTGDAALTAAIRTHTANLSARDLGEPGDAIALPWKMNALAPRTQAVLAEIGFAAAAGFELRSELVRPARQWLGVGLAAGAALAGLLGVALWPPDPEVSRDSPRSCWLSQVVPGGEHILACATPHYYYAAVIDGDKMPKIIDSDEVLRCRDKTEIRCDRAGRPSSTERWKKGSFFSIRLTRAPERFEELAYKLIESGTATYVSSEPFVGRNRQRLGPLSIALELIDQYANVEGDGDALLNALDFDGERAMKEVFGAQLVDSSPNAIIIGSGATRPTARDAGIADREVVDGEAADVEVLDAEPATAVDDGGVRDGSVSPAQEEFERALAMLERVRKILSDLEESKNEARYRALVIRYNAIRSRVLRAASDDVKEELAAEIAQLDRDVQAYASERPVTLRITGIPDRVLIQRASDTFEEGKLTVTLDGRPLRTRTPTVTAGDHTLVVSDAAGELRTKSVSVGLMPADVDFQLDVQPPKGGLLLHEVANVVGKDGRLSPRLMAGAVHLRDPGIYELRLLWHGSMRVRVEAGTLTHVVPQGTVNAIFIENLPNDSEALIDGQTVRIQDGFVPVPSGKKTVALKLRHPSYYDLYLREVRVTDTTSATIKLEKPRSACIFWVATKWEEGAVDLRAAGFRRYAKKAVAPSDRLFVQLSPTRSSGAITWRSPQQPNQSARKPLEPEQLGPFETFVPHLFELRGYTFESSKTPGTSERAVIEIGQREICTFDPERTDTSQLCGDNIPGNDPNEQCDDGNTINGDGCSATCLIEDPRTSPQ